jgi:hypothetical protein
VPGQVNGRYFTEMAEVPAAPAALDDAAALRLWEVSEALTLPYLTNP